MTVDSQNFSRTLSFFFSSFFFFHLTYSRWTSSLPSCLWSQRIFPSLPGSRLIIFYRDASSALLQLVNQWLNRQVVVVVVVDSHIQRIVLATEETTVTQQVSPRPIKCQSRLWSQRGTKVNGSHHGDNPLLRPTGPNRDKKLCGSTSNGTDQYQNGSSNLLTPYREQSRSTRNVVAYPRPAFSAKNRKNYAPTSFDQQVQISQGHTFCTEIRKIEIPRSMVVEALNW